MDLGVEVYELVKNLPREETYAIKKRIMAIKKMLNALIKAKKGS